MMVNNKFVCEECHKEYNYSFLDHSVRIMECCVECSPRVKKMYGVDNV